jgi:hypothetical protein
MSTILVVTSCCVMVAVVMVVVMSYELFDTFDVFGGRTSFDYYPLLWW